MSFVVRNLALNTDLGGISPRIEQELIGLQSCLSAHSTLNRNWQSVYDNQRLKTGEYEMRRRGDEKSE